jgi:hypothetical protein
MDAAALMTDDPSASSSVRVHVGVGEPEGAFALSPEPAAASLSYGPPWRARHGLTSTQYQAEFYSLAQQGYRLQYVSGYTVGGEERFAALWEQKPGPAWVARHGLTAAQYQAEFHTLASQGFRLVLVNGYSVNRQDRYVAIWEQAAGPAWVARHGMTATEYQSEFNKYTGQGFRLTHVSGYAVKNADR